MPTRSSTQLLLSAEEAAARIFGTTNPTVEQIRSVQGWIQAGVLEAGAKENSTTSESVALFMARQEMHRATQRHKQDSRRGATGSFAGSRDPHVSRLYENMWREYFLAVLLQRSSKDRSRWFATAVIATQVLILLIGLGIIGVSVATVWKVPLKSSEQRAAEAWLQQKFRNPVVQQFQSKSDAPGRYVVHFGYEDNGRQIQSRLILTMQGGSVTSADSSE